MPQQIFFVCYCYITSRDSIFIFAALLFCFHSFLRRQSLPNPFLIGLNLLRCMQSIFWFMLAFCYVKQSHSIRFVKWWVNSFSMVTICYYFIIWTTMNHIRIQMHTLKYKVVIISFAFQKITISFARLNNKHITEQFGEIQIPIGIFVVVLK